MVEMGLAAPVGAAQFAGGRLVHAEVRAHRDAIGPRARWRDTKPQRTSSTTCSIGRS